MTAVDSLDNVLMLSAYTVPQRSQNDFGYEKEEREKKWWKRWQLFERRKAEGEVDEDEAEMRARMLPMPDQDKLLSISVVLTVISIVVALLISITGTSSSSFITYLRCRELTSLRQLAEFMGLVASPLFFLFFRNSELTLLSSLAVSPWRNALPAPMQLRTTRDSVRRLALLHPLFPLTSAPSRPPSSP
jgi:hypothetical protein